MKSNYMKSAELKIARNPDMTKQNKDLLLWEAKQKELELNIKLGLAYRVYISTDSYPRNRGLRAQSYFIDEFMNAPIQTTTTATQLTRENLDRLIENVRATSYDGFSTGRDSYNYTYTWDPNSVVSVRWDG